MSCSVSFKELVNLAIGSPELGAVNFNALHSLLHGLLEHLQVGEVRRDLSQEEKDFIQPDLSPGGLATEEGRQTSLFHQLQERMGRMEAKLLHLDSLPSSSTLLLGSQSQNKPVQEMWQLMQLKKKVEMNEDGVNKAMNAFQELLSTFNSLKQTTDLIQADLAALSDRVTKINIHDIEQKLQQLVEKSETMHVLADQLEILQNKLSSYPEPADVVTWPSLHDAMTVTTSDLTLSNDVKQRYAMTMLSSLGHLPSKHEVLEFRALDIEKELKRLEAEISKMGIPEDLLQQLQSLRNDVEKILDQNKTDKDELKNLQSALQKLDKALQRLDTKTDALGDNLAETATLQIQIDALEGKKMDRDEMMLELNTKADKRAVDAKVGNDQLEATMSEVSTVLDDLMKKLALQEAEWQSMLGKLLAGLEDKLGRSDLDSVLRDLEEMWRILKKHDSVEEQFDLDSAAGSRKKLFEKVRCISCDRSVTMATGPHLITVRTAPLLPRNRPNSTEFSRDQNSGETLEMSDPEFQYSEIPRPHTACSHHKKKSRVQNLTTVYPYGDPAHIQYRNSIVDLMGIDGLMYKGRLEKNLYSHIPERDPSVAKTPHPPYRIERARASTAQPAGSTTPPITRSASRSARSCRTQIQMLAVTETFPDSPSLPQRPLSATERRPSQ